MGVGVGERIVLNLDLGLKLIFFKIIFLWYFVKNLLFLVSFDGYESLFLIILFL